MGNSYRWLDASLLLFAMASSAFAGLVAHLQKYKAGELKLSLLGVLVDLAIAIFAGFTGFLTMQWIGVGEIGSVLVAITLAHLGGEGIKFIQQIILEVVRTRVLPRENTSQK